MQSKYLPFFIEEKHTKRKTMALQGVELYQKWLQELLLNRKENWFLSYHPSIDALSRDFMDLGLGGFARRLRILLKEDFGVLEGKQKIIRELSIIQCLCYALLNYKDLKMSLYEEALHLAGLNLYQSEMESRNAMVSPGFCIAQEQGMVEGIAWRKDWFLLEENKSLCYSYSTAFRYFEEPQALREGQVFDLTFVPYPGWGWGSSRLHIVQMHPLKTDNFPIEGCLLDWIAFERKRAEVFSQRPWMEDCRSIIKGLEFVKMGAQLFVKAKNAVGYPVQLTREKDLDPTLALESDRNNQFWIASIKEAKIDLSPFCISRVGN